MGISVLVATLGTLTGVLLARSLGLAGRGEVAALITWTGFILSSSTLGLEDALTYRAAAYLSNGSVRPIEIVKWSLSLGVIGGGAAGAAVLLLPIEADHLPVLAVLTALGGSVLVVHNCLLGVAMSFQRFDTWNRARIIIPVVYAVSLFVLVSLYGGSTLIVVISLSLSWLVATIFTASSIRAYLRVNVFGSKPLARRIEMPSRLRETLAYGVRSHLARMAGYANERLDQAVLVFLVPMTTLGEYAVAATVATMAPSSLYQAQARLVFGRLCQTQRERALTADDAWVDLRKVFIVAIPLQTAIALASPIAVPALFGQNFTRAGIVASFLALATIPNAVSRVLQSWLKAAGQVGMASRIELVSVFVGLAVLLPTARAVGIWGAVVASWVTYLFSAIIHVIVIRRQTQRVMPAAR